MNKFHYLTICFLIFALGLYSPRAQSLQQTIEESKTAQSEFYIIDSLNNRDSKAKLGNNNQNTTIPTSTLDSLIQGPMEDSSKVDSIAELDTLPQRFSQKIFSKSPGSLFGSYPSAIGRSHIIGSGDEITLVIWGDVERQMELKVNNQGKAWIKDIGLVSIGGLSLGSAETLIKGKLARVYSGIRKSRPTTFVELSQGNSGPVKVFVLGEVVIPGGYSFTGNTSVLSAFYHAKGPTDIGSVRKIQLTRASKSIDLDLYQYLLKGKSLEENTLQDGDILFSPRAEILVEISGDVGRPAIYELKKQEGIKELIEFAGGLNPTAAKHRISVTRITDKGDAFIDISSPQNYLSGKEKFFLQNGDRVLIEKSTEPSEQFIWVTGPVKYEGKYSSQSVKNLSDLIKVAGGLKEEAYLGRVHILRFLLDGSSQLFSYSLSNLELDSIQLLGKDNVILYSQKDLLAPDSVEIYGAILKPGKYLFSIGMTVKDLVLRAGGFLPNHEKGKALCFRINQNGRKVTSHDLKMSDGLQNVGNEFSLKPRDLIHIPIDPGWYEKEIITLKGEFKNPGVYTLLFPGEKLISVIKRAGGLKENAYIPGFKFFRTKNNIGRIGIDLTQAMIEGNVRMNISLQDGDSLIIPELQNSVKVIGEVGIPTSVLFKKGGSVNYYIARAGGFTRFSDKKHVVLEYANGETTSEFYRNPDPGSVIYVPNKPEEPPTNWVQITDAFVSTLTATATLILAIIAINGKI